MVLQCIDVAVMVKQSPVVATSWVTGSSHSSCEAYSMDSALELIKEMQHRLLCTSELAVIDAVAESGSVQDITTLGCHMEVSDKFVDDQHA